MTVYTRPGSPEPKCSFWATYERLNLPVWATSLDVIRKARSRLTPGARKSRKLRAARHEFYRDILDCHRRAADLYRRVQTGDFNDDR